MSKILGAQVELVVHFRILCTTHLSFFPLTLFLPTLRLDPRHCTVRDRPYLSLGLRPERGFRPPTSPIPYLQK